MKSPFRGWQQAPRLPQVIQLPVTLAPLLEELAQSQQRTPEELLTEIAVNALLLQHQKRIQHPEAPHAN